MSNSIRLGQIRGITIRLHYMVPLLLGLLLLAPGFGAPAVLLYTFLLAPIVLLHELGHSIVAQRFGIRVLDITFWPLGGMARMSQIPEDSRIEGWIAVAGPLVNFALALVAAPLVFLPGALHDVALAFVGINLMLGTFNLLPAFPMDGGRVLRAWLGRKGDWLAATEQAVRIGRYVAFLMFAAAFVWSPMLALIGLFVWWAGGQELAAVRLRHHGPPIWSFGPFRMHWSQGAPPGAAPPPREAATRPPPSNGASSAPARRPVEASGGTKRGWSDQDLERLERFPGPLRTFRPE